ncbi:protein purity of essence isoform X2 [Teleopsis dalmanni]|uniref:protein purity of essence isoform X2 n=1 Tax=Teleopsis dalmanni TaxID=139649 RepID=UPI0018CD7192|nr:protein purity of essence isoform X2 [Teleopsis dalmanni]
MSNTKMAAHSGGGIDWSSVVKPLLSSRFGVLNKSEINNLTKAILRCESEFFDEDNHSNPFYTAFAALAADKLSQSKIVNPRDVPQIYEATSVLISFILSRLNKVNVYEIKWLLPVLKNLCEGKNQTQSKPVFTTTASGTTLTSSSLLQFDFNHVASILKTSKYPEISKCILTANEKDSPKSEIRRSRSDLSSIIVQQLTAPLESGRLLWASLSEEPAECTETFAAANIAHLQSANGGETILEMCSLLPTLLRYRLKHLETVATVNSKPLYLPLTQADAVLFKNQLIHIVNDISILYQALSLPIIEPLSASRIQKLSKCAISALYCAVLTSMANSVTTMVSANLTQKGQAQTPANIISSNQTAKDVDEADEQARFIVDKSLEIYTIIGNIFNNHARSHVYQNHLCAGAWLLVSGIQGALGASGNTSAFNSKQPSTYDENVRTKLNTKLASDNTPPAATARVNLFKVQQGFGVLNAALANHCIQLLSELIEDLKIESNSSEANANQNVPDPTNFDILENYTSLERIIRVLSIAPMHQLFTFLATVSYRKACALKRANAKDRAECEPISYSDSTTCFNDTLSCSDNSEEDDSESYLGHWFKETLSPEAVEDTNVQVPDRSNENQKSNLMIAGDEPHEYLDLAAQIFCFLDLFLINKNDYMHRYVKVGLSDHQMNLLANILKDLDRDNARGECETGTCAKWQTAMMRFSGAVGRYLHNLISASLLSESLQVSLLQYLSVSPWTNDTNVWPLQVYSNTLSVLVQIILLRPAHEKEAACLSVWQRLINTLAEGVCGPLIATTASDVDYEDLNIEHAQLMLFLFHSLNLMQKKSILLLNAGAVIRCAENCRSIPTDRPLRNSQIMLLSRLLLLLEYLMKHLYNAPAELLDQVRWNLFSVSSLQESQKVSDLLSSKAKLISFNRKDIEDKFRKQSSECMSNIRPTFYSLTLLDPPTNGLQQEFKLDGLAWNFILCTPDKLKYNVLVNALIDILNIVDMAQFKLHADTRFAIQYCFSLCWKLVLGMPPSLQHVEKLPEETEPNLHSLLWSIRFPSTQAHYLIVNSLVKQGIYTQTAENLWTTTTDKVTEMRYKLKQTIHAVDYFLHNINKKNPLVSYLLVLDAAVCHLHAVTWAEKEGVKSIRSNTSNATSSSNSGSASPSLTISTSPTGNNEPDIYSSSESIDQKVDSPPPGKPQERSQLTKKLILQLIETYSIISDTVGKKMVQQMGDVIPVNVINLVIPIASTKNLLISEINNTFLKMITNADKEIVITEWTKCLEVSDAAFSVQNYPVEEYTLTVIEAHISELTRTSNYTTLNSLKHCIKSCLNLINLLLPHCSVEGCNELAERLQPILVRNMLDIRMEHFHDISEKCMQTLTDITENTTEDFQLVIHEYIFKYCYHLQLELGEDLRHTSTPTRRVVFCETMMFAILKTMNQLIEKPVGLKAIYKFIKINNEGNMVDLLLSFTGTSMPMLYANNFLQFIEKLFKLAEKADSPFPIDELVQCVANLVNTDVVRIKSWLSHIIFGANSSQGGSEAADKQLACMQPSSTPSSNAQTPTNMATVSAMPSISDQLAQSSVLDADAMETDDDGAVACITNTSIPAQALSICWQNANSYVTNHSEVSTQEETGERNGSLLLNVIKYFVRDGKSTAAVANVLFQSLLQLGQTLIAPPQETSDFADILQIMVTLADTMQGRGHATLFSATLMWLDITKFQIIQKCFNIKTTINLLSTITLDNISALLKYLLELLQSLGYKGSRTISPPWDDDFQFLFEDANEDISPDDEESCVDEFDDDNINNKLCTFSQTQKEFMNQHWYHCHTCNMINTVGVCSVCAKVCHKGHDVSYAKYGNFFCDCGAKEDGSCQALSRRVSSTGAENRNHADFSHSLSNNLGLLSNKKRLQTTPSQFSVSNLSSERITFLTKLLDSCRETLHNSEQWTVIARCILDLFEILLPVMRENCALYSIVGCHLRAKTALEHLHMPDHSFQFSEHLMVATLGSQEGAFENVRMNYSGDQGQTIKQLLSSGLVRRVALCCLTSTHGRRQHLAVSHEKGKVTILQLSALLKQADQSKRKLTLTQLSSAPIPCTVLSLAANSANEDCLAVCGLKECHIVTFSNTGTTNEHIVLTPQLENGNFIKKALWLPGSQTMLALVTADYVKIYELAEDAYSPKYYFLVAIGKIRDCTFVYHNNDYYMLLIASSGYIYYQKLDDQSLAKHGDFYVTSTLELAHPQIKDVNGQIGGGGVSIYYSHTLQLLFYSYQMGRSFVSPLTDVNKGVKCITLLQTGQVNKTSSKGPPQPLCQWMEITGHPGLICAMMQTSNNPCIFMFTPDRIVMQEIKAQSSKSRIMDMVAIRHLVSGVEKTTLILLCEDGSLRIFTANPECTNFWLSPQVQPTGNQLYASIRPPPTPKKTKRKSANSQKSTAANGNPVFPIDFFEHCTMLPDVEFGGNDLLQIYNKQKLKTRLGSTGMFVASTKPNGFTLEIMNNDPNTAIVGIRVMLGSQDPLRAPQTVSVFGRTINTFLRRPRWFDIPLTREEILHSDKLVKVVFGKSQDAENISMVDSVEVYGKAKDLIGWPDESEETAVTTAPIGATTTNTNTHNQGTGNSYAEGYHTLTALDKMITSLLEVLDCSLNLLGGTNVVNTLKQKAIKTATTILMMPTAYQVQVQTRYVLATLLGNRTSYHNYKDNEMLAYINSELQSIKHRLATKETIKDVDPEAFYRLVLIARNIATMRPQSLMKICTEHKYNIVEDIMYFIEELHRITPHPDEPTSLVRRGLSHAETTVHCLVEIMHAFALSDSNLIENITAQYIKLLKNDSSIISHSAKEAIIMLLGPRVKRRRVAIITPPVCSTPTPSNTSNTIISSNIRSLQAAAVQEEMGIVPIIPSVEELIEREHEAVVNSVAAVGRSNSAEFVDANALESVQHDQHQLLNLDPFMGGFPQLLGLQQDADDEAIIDIAIALSLQQHEGDGLQSLQQGLANLQGIRNSGNLPGLDGTNAGANAVSVSAGGSDDEGSNVATDGSTLRTSPAEPAGSGGSESGGSGVESIGCTSGRSSTYGDQVNSSPPRSGNTQVDIQMSTKAGNNGEAIGMTTDDSSVGGVSGVVGSTENDDDSEDECLIKLHDLRLDILENIIANIRTLDVCNGMKCIPLIQVILMLTNDLNGNSERDQRILNELITILVEYIEMEKGSQSIKQSDKNEVRLIILCLFGVLMGKSKSKQAGTTSPPHQFKDNATFVAGTTANILSNSGAFAFSLTVMETLLEHWKRATEQNSNSSHSSTAGGAPVAGASGSSTTPPQNCLLKSSKIGPKPDISSIIPHNYLKNYPDIFEQYDAMLTEISVRLPYQILRLSSTHPGTYDWYHSYCENMTYTLCEYMMLNLNALLRRQVRKLLMYICGNKEKFRMFRDGHSLDVHFNHVKKLCRLSNTKNAVLSNQSVPILPYDSLVELTEHLRTCQEISQIRTGNWQKFCIIHDDVIPVLIEIACFQLDDGVLPIVLQLLQAALCNSIQAVKQQQQQLQQQQQQQQPSTSKQRSDRDKSEETEVSFDSKFDQAHCSTFVHQIFRYVSDNLLNKFVRIFLLETNITSLRWQAHSLIYAIYENSNERQKEKLISVLWNMWPLVPAFGRRTAQFVDILGYLTLSTKTIVDKLPEYTEKAVEVLRQQNELLYKHPNAPIYSSLEQILQVNGFYLESEPCLVCNNPEVPMANIKLPSIKSDSKFTTTTMIVKLVQSHNISKLIVRVADLKRTKMVKTINIYYNNRTVQAVVELKNRPAMWHKARSITLQSAQTEVKIDFPLPITACNLMIEYADFYETVTGSSENLQCPRCSAAVPAYPGVCGNCGENVFQCHKCRAINYDEKDPFLCHSCGFCKYAKFDFSIYGRVCCAVDPIESAEDRVKTVQIIHSSLERADRIYRQLQTCKQMLELLIQKMNEHRSADRALDDTFGAVHSTSQVNKLIQMLAQKYCVETRGSFEELSKIVQKVKACRSELVAYDRSQQDQPNGSSGYDERDTYNINRCYGCALASTEHCLTLLRAMASNTDCCAGLHAQGLVEELAQHNLRRGTPQNQDEVRNLLVLLTKNNREACMSLIELIQDRVKTALLGAIPVVNMDSAIHHEMILLEVLIGQDEFCWEEKLRVVFELFLITSQLPRGPSLAVLQPCLRIMQGLISPTIPTSKINRDLSPSELSSILCLDAITVDFGNWLAGDPDNSYAAWKSRMPANIVANRARRPGFGFNDDRLLVSILQSIVSENAGNTAMDMREIEMLKHKKSLMHEVYLIEKYGQRWRRSFLRKDYKYAPLQLHASWIQPILFNSNSRISRQLASSVITSLSRTHDRKREILNLLTSFLKHVCEAGEASTEFLALYRSLAADKPWRQYLALKGVLLEISRLLSGEIIKIHRLEETTLSSDLSQGFALRQLVELMSLFLEKPTIRQAYKSRLLGTVLEGYLSLRKLIVQRTRLIDDAQEKLLEMLEEMTSGTEEETRAFMEILIDTVEKTRMNDIKTPVFVFERLYSIIHPEENDEGEFFMTLEKDPQQEDFLQGRMLGNPYPCSEVGLGPLMRDVKNKICTDCELIALLEDDNGMELLVNNKIISLDLPVKEVYKKIWIAEGGDRDAMRIVYRMRGLLGDATEEFVETLNNKSQEEVDTEQLYRMANVLADCNGLKVMLDRIGSLQSISRTRELIQVLLKLFLICVKVRRCQDMLCQPELGAINTLLKVLQMCLQSENDSLQSSVTEQLLDIMETILSKASSDTLDSFLQFSLTFGGPEYVTALINCTDCTNVRNNPSVLRHLIRVLAALVYGNEVKMALLCEHFKDILDFERLDVDRTPAMDFKLELFCVLANQIEHNCIGGTLKDYIVSLGIVENAISYITYHAPCVKPTLLRIDSDELKEFISRPSLKYILRFLTGLATRHEATQLAISKDIIPIIHRLEQVSSDEHVGSLAENLLEALCTDAATAARVQEVRDFTRAEKKRLAMATRERQLDALGMRTNEKGQVTAKGSILQKIEKLRDETGLTCFICREGYACQPTKVLGIYTFTKRCNVEEFDMKPRKSIGYTTVTHFNVVHVDCHTSAIRLSRGRDEWERASLQNANTRCNSLLPLWGPEVTESTFSACMTRHTSYMQEATQRCDISYTNSVHDLKLLLMRFAWERSFHDDAGGGGPQSNMHFVPYLLFYSVYLLLSSRSAARDSKALTTYVNNPPCDKWLECAYEAEGPVYMTTISLTLHSRDMWNKNKIMHLKRLIVVAQTRFVSPSLVCKALLTTSDREFKHYTLYRPYLMLWALVDLIYNNLFKTVTTPKEEDWCISLFDFIRKNDEAMLNTTDSILQTFTEEILPCTTFYEFCDVVGLLHIIENPDIFIDDVLQSLPSTSA